MNDLIKYERQIERYIREGKTDKATQELLSLITRYAQRHDFDKAESLREKIISIDSTALSAVILAQEIIDTAYANPPQLGHREVWAKLYDKFNAEEAEAFESELIEVSFEPNETIFEQGQKKDNLYFIDSGQGKHVFTQKNREMFIKKVSSGSVANEDSFFDAGLCTSTLVVTEKMNVHFLPAITLLSWEGYLPTIEPKLRDFCANTTKIRDLLSKNSQDRRDQRRIKLPGRILLKVVNSEGTVVGKTIRGSISDVSIGGVSFYVEAQNRENAQRLLGHNLHLRFNLPPNMQEVEQIGKVLGVKRNSNDAETKDKYSVHVKFSKLLPDSNILEAERYIKMIKITENHR